MRVEVFDDAKGLIAHLLMGGVTSLIPIFFVVFIAYEYIEYIYLAGKEKEANFLGDILEFSFGVMLMTILVGSLNCLGAVVFIGFIIGLYYCVRREWR